MSSCSRSLPLLAAVAALVLAAGCAISRSVPSDDENESMSPAGDMNAAPPALSTNLDERRPLPDEVEPPAGFQEAVENGTRTRDGRPGPSYWINRPSYDLDVEVLPEGPGGEPRLDGRARIRYQNNSPDTLGLLVLELAQNHHKAGVRRNRDDEVTGGIDIDRLAVNGSEVQAGRQGRPGYTVSDTRLIVAPAQPVLPGATVRLDVDYGFTIPQSGIGGRMGYSGAERYGRTNLFYLGYFYPIMSVYDDVNLREDLRGWMADRYLGNAEFYSDHGDYDLSITAPAGWTVQSTGTLENPSEVLRDDVRRRLQQAYRSDEPMTILEPGERATPIPDDGEETLTWEFQATGVRDVAFSVMRGGGAWQWDGARTPVGDRDGDGQTDYTHIDAFWREKAPLWSEMARYEQDAITHHSQFTGVSYPWPHMSSVEGAGIIGGGMEFPMMSLMGPYKGREPSDLYSVAAHELAHMWVPMTISTNERRYGWMDEGTTTFNEAEARKDFYPDNGNRPHVQDQQRYISAVQAGVEAPILRWSDYQYTSAAYTTASYPKQASMWQALRGLLGEEDFLDAYHAFLNLWAYKHPLPYDYFNFFEDAYGKDLDWLWDSFYKEDWSLDQAVASVENTDSGGVHVTVRDEGRAVMPVDLTLTLSNGDTVTRRVPVDPWLRGQREATLTVQTDAPARRVEIDAGHYYPDTDRSDNVWER